MDIGLIFAIAFWVSFACAPLLAGYGVWKQSRITLFTSAVWSLPFVLIIIAHPATRYFIALPVLHIVAALTTKTSARWIGWLMLALIAILSAWFLIVRFG
ncbi:MAG: hypothetical protein HZC40_13060 [Chloroflexi bacterium]|nr:hypothetical protein [Chloroflexota bacterium]